MTIKKKHPKKVANFMDGRNLDYMKPQKYINHLTLGEVAKEVGCDNSWIRKLERAKRIPQAQRVQRGSLSVRLWSPEQVAEIKEIMAQHEPGRPRKEATVHG